VSSYLALAKRVSKKVPTSPEAVAERRERRREQAGRRGLLVRWSEYPTWIKLHDPTTGDWNEVKASGCLPGIVTEADKHRKKVGLTSGCLIRIPAKYCLLLGRIWPPVVVRMAPDGLRLLA